jgi:signal transduction histidine kinase/AraC-like DNA-binding protein
VVNPLHSPRRSAYIQSLIASGHPVVFIGAGERGPKIVADNAKGIMDALQHLVEHGHRRIAFIAGSPEDMDGDTGDRLRAYQAGLTAFGLTVDENLIAFGRHVFEHGRAAMRRILSTQSPFTAVIASNDESAFGAMEALREAGKNIPSDVAIIGFDDRPESAVHQPALTTVQVPLFKMGTQAVELLLERMRGGHDPAHQIKVPTRLMIRESCGCGHSAVLADTLEIVSPRRDGKQPTELQHHLAQRMAAAVLAQNRRLGSEEVSLLCQKLTNSFMTSIQENDPASFRETLGEVLSQAAASRDDAHVWQAAISILRDALPQIVATIPHPASAESANAFLDEARVTISAAVHLQHRQYVVDQRKINARVGILTAHLLTALNETHIYDILARYLPAVGIRTAWVAQFASDGDDPVAWSHLRDLIAPTQPAIRIRSREFPSRAWTASHQPFSLALLPLVSHRAGTGFVAFEAVHLDLHGAIVQQMSAALNTAQLYREATEGRRLAEEANRLKSRFLSTVSHELRTPLNLIMGMSGLLLQESEEHGQDLPEQIHADIERIYMNARHLGRLIDDVLDLASSDARQLRLNYEFVDLGQVLRSAQEAGRQMAADKGLAWRTSLPDSGPWVWGDRTRLYQVILNLISNAVKFTSEGEVCLEVTTEPGTVTVCVRDTGLGLPPADQRAIFEEFQRSERSIIRGYGGIGLGLAICKRLVTMHGGSIGVRSSGEEGAGSEFFFTLPTVPAPTAKLPDELHLAETGQQILVLSGQGKGQQLHQHLAQRGFQVKVLPIEDSVTWLSALLTIPYDAVVLDISHGPEYGWQALKLLKSNPATQQIPALFYAATEESGVVLELNYLTKPIELTGLARALDQYLITTDDSAPTRTFLVADDDPQTLDLHARLIQSQSPSYRVLRARSGREALEILQQTRVDLVLLDLMMPELDGFGVLEAMREDERTRDIPVIVVTGQLLTDSEMERLNRGVATVLGKGMFGPDETLAHLDAALKRTRKLSGEAQRLVRKAMAYIHTHFAEPISRQDLARHVGMSDDYLSYCFRQELGMTPIAYLNRYRVIQAKQLLSQTNKTITDIALDVGFSSSGYFSRVFRREVGVSPQEFRRK